MSKIQEIAEAIEGGKSKIIGGLVEAALAEGIDPLKILNEGMIATMGIIGEKFTKAEIFVPEMLVSARAMKKGVEILKPKLGANAGAALGKAIIGTTVGDLHDIGKNLVAMMIESTGFQVFDLGVDVTAEKYLECLKANPDAKIVALSSLLTTTMPSMKDIVATVKAAHKNVKVMVGGAPITQEFANQIGADGYAVDAASAAALAKKFAS